MTKVTRRDISPLLQIFRRVMAGRTWDQTQLRHQDDVAPRPYPQPNLPQGPADKVSGNYYYTRDARRDALPPIDLTKKTPLIGDGKEASSAVQSSWVAPTPGKTYNYGIYSK